MIKNNLKTNKGFTLIELMVSTAIFTFVMTVGVGSLIVSSDSARASQKLRTAVDNVNFAIESITRELRTGTYFYCSSNTVTMSNVSEVGDCSSGGTIVAFKPQVIPGSPDRIAYKRELRADGTYTLKKIEYISPGPYTEAEVVSPDVDVQVLKFYVNGSLLNDNVQPSVKILMKGVVKLKGVDTPFYLQSLASQRSSEI